MNSRVLYEKQVPGQWATFTMKELVDIPGIGLTDVIDIRRYPSSQGGGEYIDARTVLTVTRKVIHSRKETISEKDLIIGELVYHEDIYNGKELMKVTKIIKDLVELEGDYSGGTHGTIGKSQYPIKGLIRRSI